MGTLRVVGGVAGLLVGVGATVWLGVVVGARWPAVAFWSVVFGAIGARAGSLTPVSIWQHKFLLQFTPVCGAIGGFFLGVLLVHGIPAKGDFGLPVVACSAALAFLGLVLPFVALTRLVPAQCPQCGGRSYLGTDSSFFKKMLAKYRYQCGSCRHAEPLNFTNPLLRDR